MASPAVGDRSSESLLRLGPVSRVRVQVGYRDRPDGSPYEQFLLDLPLPEEDIPPGDSFDERPYLAALDPVVRAGHDVPRHYSLHVHRWHTTWGPNTGAFEIGVTVTAGRRAPGMARAAADAVLEAFRALLDLAGRPETPALTRDAAIVGARHGVAGAYGVDAETLSLTAEEHHAARQAWSLGLRTADLDRYSVLVGLVDGFAGSVHVRHERPPEVIDSVGTE
jgi:hypothetical protein